MFSVLLDLIKLFCSSDFAFWFFTCFYTIFIFELIYHMSHGGR